MYKFNSIYYELLNHVRQCMLYDRIESATMASINFYKLTNSMKKYALKVKEPDIRKYACGYVYTHARTHVLVYMDTNHMLNILK